MPMIRMLAALAILCLSVMRPAWSAEVQAGSTWVNQRGSTVTFTGVGPNGLLAGYYINRAAGFGCQNTQYPVTGWAYESDIVFTVIWNNSTQNCHSITAWTGFFTSTGFSTLWQLVQTGTTDPSQILQGSDTFMPQ